MKIEIRDFEYFAVVGEHRHVGRAAETLGLSQPALSKSLRRLESSVGAKLVKRTPKGVDLTAVGSALFLQVRRLRLTMDDITRELEDLSQARAGYLRIGVVPGIAENLVGAASGALLIQAPKARLTVTVLAPDALVAPLRNGELDFIVTTNNPTHRSDDFVSERLIDDRFVVYASVNHRLTMQKRLTLSDLSQEQWASSSVAARQWWELCRAFEESGLPLPRTVLECSSTLVRLPAIASSNLLGFSSRQFVQQATRQFRLVELPVKGVSVSRGIEIAYRKDAYLSPAAKRFMEILKTTARDVSKAG
jgi:DNA-binding transcriptional LysR family regulator